MIVKPIKLDWIEEEIVYRHGLPDSKLTSDIATNGLLVPLLVEEVIRNKKYYLIDGHRRYRSLKDSDTKYVNCKINPPTNELERGMMRLRLQIRTKKLTGYEMERLVLFLVDRDMDPKDIANEIGISTYTVKKYLRSTNVPIEVKAQAEKAKVAKDNITKLHSMIEVPGRLRKKLLSDCLNKVIRQSEVAAISKTSKIPLFSVLPENLMESAINESIKLAKFQRNDAEKVVYLEACKDTTLIIKPEIHAFASAHIKSELQQIRSICYPWLAEQFTNIDRQVINYLLKEIQLAVNTIYWHDFPGGFKTKDMSKDNK